MSRASGSRAVPCVMAKVLGMSTGVLVMRSNTFTARRLSRSALKPPDLTRLTTLGASDAPTDPQRACLQASVPCWSIVVHRWLGLARLLLGPGEIEDLAGPLELIEVHVGDAVDAEELEQRRLVATRLVDDPLQIVRLIDGDLRRCPACCFAVVVDCGGEADGGGHRFASRRR